MIVRHYRVAYGTSIEDLEADVTKLLLEGYVPHGSLAVAAGELGVSWAQPMILTTPEIGDRSD